MSFNTQLVKATRPIADQKDNDILIHELDLPDLANVAEIHLAAFLESSLASLGLEATRRYYEWQLLGPHDTVALGAYKGNVMVGYCFGGIFRGAMRRYSGVPKQKSTIFNFSIADPSLAHTKSYIS